MIYIYVCMELNSCGCNFPYHTCFETKCPLQAIEWLKKDTCKRMIQCYVKMGENDEPI